MTNSRGDIEELRHLNGSLIARYKYDAWGNTKVLDANNVEITNSSSIALQNPFRYRGYYYDSESGLYYLQSRYYDPVTCRFVNADLQIVGVGGDVLGYNLYTYCKNNPVIGVDSTGHFFKEALNWVKSKVEKGIEKVGKFLSNASNAFGTIVSTLEVFVEKLSSSLKNSVETSQRPNNIGVGTWNKQISNELNTISKIKKGASKVLKVASVAITVYDVGSEIYNNIVKGSNLETVVHEAVVDISVAGISAWAVGALTSTPVGGMVLGGVIYIMVDVIPVEGDKTLREYLKEGDG